MLFNVIINNMLKGGVKLDKKDNYIIVHPIPKTNNNLKREPSYNRNNNFRKYNDDIYYKDELLAKLAEEIMKIEIYKSKIAELEKRLEAIERSKIVTVKQDIILTNVKKVNINDLNKSATKSKAVQVYTNNMKQKLVKKEANSNAIIPKEEKNSLWQRIKKAVKSFFSSEQTEEKNNNIKQTNIILDNREFGNNQRYNQFKQSIPKITVQVNLKNKDNEKKKTSEYILDKYA